MYNYLIRRLKARHKLDRRRVEDAFFQFAVLRICSWYPDTFKSNNLVLHCSFDKTVVIIDGNLKNHCNVCYASSAGVASFLGFAWSNQSGRPTAFKSRYCAVHKDNEELVGFIIGERRIRSSTMCEVCTRCCIALTVKVIYTVGCVARKA